MSRTMMRETISVGLTALSEIPPLLYPPGTAEHWPFSDAEANTLAKRIEDVADMLPKRTKAKGMAVLGKIMPPIALLVTTVLLVKPRIDLTRALIQRNANRPRTGPHEQTANAPNAHDASIVGTIPHNNGATERPTTSAEPAASNPTNVDGSVTVVGDADRITRNSSALSDAAF